MSKFKTAFFIVVLSLAASSLTNSILGPIFQDIFSDCLQSTSLEPSVACEYGLRIVPGALTGIFLIIFSLIISGSGKNKFFRSTIGTLLTGPAYLIASIAVWRLYLRLPQREAAGLEGRSFGDYFRDYLDAGFLISIGIGAALLHLVLSALFAKLESPAQKEMPKKSKNAVTALEFDDIKKETTTSTTKEAPKKKAPAKKTIAKKSTAKKSTAKKSTSKKTTSKKSTAKKSTAKKATAKKTTTKKSTAKKTTAKKSTTSKKS